MNLVIKEVTAAGLGMGKALSEPITAGPLHHRGVVTERIWNICKLATRDAAMMKTITMGVACTAMALSSAFVPLPTIGVAHAARARPPCRDGRDRHVRVTNSTSYNIRQLYGSLVNIHNWQENVLHDLVLRPGQTINVNWDDGRCQCAFDIKAVYSDGDTSIKSAVNVCRLRAFRFSE